MKKTTSNYVINHDEKTITITKDFVKRSSVPGSKEFRELTKLHNTFAEAAGFDTKQLPQIG